MGILLSLLFDSVTVDSNIKVGVVEATAGLTPTRRDEYRLEEGRDEDRLEEGRDEYRLEGDEHRVEGRDEYRLEEV